MPVIFIYNKNNYLANYLIKIIRLPEHENGLNRVVYGLNVGDDYREEDPPLYVDSNIRTSDVTGKKNKGGGRRYLNSTKKILKNTASNLALRMKNTLHISKQEQPGVTTEEMLEKFYAEMPDKIATLVVKEEKRRRKLEEEYKKGKISSISREDSLSELFRVKETYRPKPPCVCGFDRFCNSAQCQEESKRQWEEYEKEERRQKRLRYEQAELESTGWERQRAVSPEERFNRWLENDNRDGKYIC